MKNGIFLFCFFLSGCGTYGLYIPVSDPKPYQEDTILKRNWIENEWTYEHPNAQLKYNWIEDRWEY